MAIPASYSGDAAECGGFLLQISLFIEMQLQKFTNERSKEVFGSATGMLSVEDELLRLRQGNSPTSDYTLQFRTLVATSGWNEAALMCAYRQGLNPSICMQMVIYDNNVGLESFMQWASPPIIPQYQNLCSFRLLHQDLSCPSPIPSVSALLDSGSSGNFISQRLLKQLDVPRKRQPRELRVETIQGKLFGVKYRTPPMRIGCLHEETISFLVLEGLTVNIILGRPWLNLHSRRL